MHDPAWQHGDFYGGDGPANGLAAARMLAHITYLGDDGMVDKFGRQLQGEQGETGRNSGLALSLKESYLDYRGRSFVQRFDANITST